MDEASFYRAYVVLKFLIRLFATPDLGFSTAVAPAAGLGVGAELRPVGCVLTAGAVPGFEAPAGAGLGVRPAAAAEGVVPNGCEVAVVVPEAG